MSIWQPENLAEHLLHDFGHTLTAAFVAMLLWLLGVAELWALAIGCLGVPLVQETWDFFKYAEARRISKDTIHDVATYQLPWVPWLWMYGHWIVGVVVLVLVVCSVSIYYYEKLR